MKYLAKAADYFTRWLSLTPPERQNEKFLRSVGQMRYDLGELDKAEELLLRALANMKKPILVKENAAFLFKLAQIYMERNDPGSARPYLEKLACRNGDDAKLIKEMVGELALGNQEIGGLKAEKAALQAKLDKRWHPVKIALVGAGAVVLAEVIAVVVYVVAFKTPSS